MNKLLCGFAFSVLSASSFAALQPINTPSENTQLLPSPYPVYILPNHGVVNQPYTGTTKAMLPTDNSYTSAPGCYIACYSHNPGIYSVGSNIYVMGQVRTKGQYVNRVCQPAGYESKDISAADSFKQLCAAKIATCRDYSCWAGGDTGGWFGIQ